MQIHHPLGGVWLAHDSGDRAGLVAKGFFDLHFLGRERRQVRLSLGAGFIFDFGNEFLVRPNGRNPVDDEIFNFLRRDRAGFAGMVALFRGLLAHVVSIPDFPFCRVGVAHGGATGAAFEDSA